LWRLSIGALSVVKSELVQRISDQKLHLYERDVARVVDAMLEEIVAALARGDRVELRGFGVFSVKVRQARTGRNPRTGAMVPVGQKAIPFFKSGEVMRKCLNVGSTSTESARALAEGPQSFLAAGAVQPPSATSVPGITPSDGEPAPSS
jgi:integration host factor subunit beta